MRFVVARQMEATLVWVDGLVPDAALLSTALLESGGSHPQLPQGYSRQNHGYRARILAATAHGTGSASTPALARSSRMRERAMVAHAKSCSPLPRNELCCNVDNRRVNTA